MANWHEIFESVKTLNALEEKKKYYFKKMKQYTKRNIIVYFSSWQQKPGVNGLFSIDDDDRNGFMNALSNVDKSKGLDLIIHTPGGDTAATQSIVNYLFNFFNGDIRVIVPHTAMSAGTMIACASKEIIMAKHSNLGPIDPQISGIPAYEYLKLFKDAQKDLNSNINVNYWINTLSKYPPAFFGICQNAINSSKSIVTQWLQRCMLKNDYQSASDTVDYLMDYKQHLLHNNRLDIDTLQKNTKLTIIPLEIDSKLQDYVLSLYHCYQILSSMSPIAKIIENDKSLKYIKNVQVQKV